MDKSKSHSAAFGSSNISDAAARRREIFLRYSKRPKTVKEIEIQKAYKDRFQNLVVGVHMIRKWLRARKRWRMMKNCLKTVWFLRNPPPPLVAPGWHTLRGITPVLTMCSDEEKFTKVAGMFWELATNYRPSKKKITKRQYFLTMLRLAKALLSVFDAKSVLKTVEADWGTDASSKKYMTFLEMRSGLRELAKTWVKGEAAATMFLTQLFKGTTKILGTHAENHKPKWRKMNEITCILTAHGKVDPLKLTEGLTSTWEEIEAHERIVVDEEKLAAQEKFVPRDFGGGRVFVQRKHTGSWNMLDNMPKRLQFIVPIRPLTPKSPEPNNFGPKTVSDPVSNSRSPRSPSPHWKHVTIIPDEAKAALKSPVRTRPKTAVAHITPKVPLVREIKFFQSAYGKFKPKRSATDFPLWNIPRSTHEDIELGLPSQRGQKQQSPSIDASTPLPHVYKNFDSSPRADDDERFQHYVTPSFQPASTRVWQFGEKKEVCSYDGYHRVLFVDKDVNNHRHSPAIEMDPEAYFKKKTFHAHRPHTSEPSGGGARNPKQQRQRMPKHRSQHQAAHKDHLHYRSGMLQTVQRINDLSIPKAKGERKRRWNLPSL